MLTSPRVVTLRTLARQNCSSKAVNTESSNQSKIFLFSLLRQFRESSPESLQNSYYSPHTHIHMSNCPRKWADVMFCDSPVSLPQVSYSPEEDRLSTKHPAPRVSNLLPERFLRNLSLMVLLNGFHNGHSLDCIASPPVPSPAGGLFKGLKASSRPSNLNIK